MAGKTKDAETPGKKPISPEDWAKALEALNTKGDADVLYLKEGRTKLKLVTDPDDPREFFTEVKRNWQGNTRTRFLMKVVNFAVEPPAVKALVVPKVVLRSILSLLAEGYDLFDPVEGHGITIAKTGKGLEVAYSVVPSPKPVPYPSNTVSLDTPLKDIAKRIEESDAQRAAQGGGKGGGKAKAEDDEEEVEW